jgi:predicted RecB family nuclease
VFAIQCGEGSLDFERMTGKTEEAARRGADVYQAAFVDGPWRGLADFVEGQPDGGYEAVDTKLARRAKPAHVLQLRFHTEQIAHIQGRLRSTMHESTSCGVACGCFGAS